MQSVCITFVNKGHSQLCKKAKDSRRLSILPTSVWPLRLILGFCDYKKLCNVRPHKMSEAKPAQDKADNATKEEKVCDVQFFTKSD